MMNMNLWRPWCCAGCRETSIGRICYAGNNNKVVDNPYCGKHFGEVYTQTKRLIKAAHEGKPAGEYFLVQNFRNGPPPPMPSSVEQIIAEGVKIADEKD